MSDFVEINPGDEAPDETQQYIDEMVAKADGGTGNEEQSLLAGKYTSEAELEKGVLELLKKNKGGNLEEVYKDLERGLGKAQKEEVAPPGAEDAPEGSPEQPKKEEGEGSKKEEMAPDNGKADKSGNDIDYTALSQEFFEQGTLSESSYEKLNKAGIPKPMVEAYIEGQRALADKMIGEITTIAGGQEQYHQIVGWAKDNMSVSEQKAFNKAVQSGDVDTMKMAVKALKASYVEANGSSPKLVKPSATSSGQDVYTSWKDVSLDMAKPEYKKSPTFRDTVARKMERSNL